MQKKLLCTTLFVAGISWNSFSNTGKLQQIKNISEETGDVAVYVTSADRQYDLDKTSVGFSNKIGGIVQVVNGH